MKALEGSNLRLKNIPELFEMLLKTDEEKDAAFWIEADEAKQRYVDAGTAPGIATILGMKEVYDATGNAPEEAMPLIRPELIAAAQREAEATAAGRALGQEAAEQQIFDASTAGAFTGAGEAPPKGPVAREVVREQYRREVLGKQLGEGTSTRLGHMRAYATVVKNVVDMVKDYAKIGKPLPVGPGEVYRKYADKWGIGADEDRIKLRSWAAQLFGLLYDMRGKQLSDKEVGLGEQMMAALNEDELAFKTKLYTFLHYVIGQVGGEIEALDASGYDVESFVPIIEEMRSITKREPSEQAAAKEFIVGKTYKTVRGPAIFKGYTEDGRSRWGQVKQK
jgi:hypothetical protein